MRSIRLSKFNFVVALAAVLMVTCVAVGGPPLLCHPVKISEGKSLPWGKDAFSKAAGYKADNVVKDTLALLHADAAILTRMETLRRATLYIDRDGAKADQLLGALMARVLDGEGAGENQQALAYFDAGYLAACLRQSGAATSFGPAVTKGDGAAAIPGYTWAARAYKLSGENTDIALAIALMIADSRTPECETYLRQAITNGAAADANRSDLLGWIAQIKGTTLEGLRDKFGQSDARSKR